jgi:hypothetical protein
MERRGQTMTVSAGAASTGHTAVGGQPVTVETIGSAGEYPS